MPRRCMPRPSRLLQVALGIEAAPMFARCSAIFSPATSAKIGADALCSVSSAAMTTLSIRLQVRPVAAASGPACWLRKQSTIITLRLLLSLLPERAHPRLGH